jgi:hypothetical protein
LFISFFLLQTFIALKKTGLAASLCAEMAQILKVINTKSSQKKKNKTIANNKKPKKK